MKFTPGIAIGAASGSIGGTVFSRNRYGAYTRVRAIPVNPDTLAQQNARSRFATFSQAWQTETAATQLAWKNWAAENPVINTLGQQQQLTGHSAYVGINVRLAQAGDAAIVLPPLTPAPVSLVTLTGTWDIGIGTFELAFTATPLGAADKMWVQAAVVNSAGITYIKNRLRVVVISAAAQATGLDTLTDIEAVFGTLSVGQVVHVWASVFNNLTGLLSVPLSVSGTVVST